MKRFILYLLPFFFAACACTDTPGEPEVPVLEESDFEDYSSVPVSSEITDVQPMTGIVLWSDSSAANKNWVTMEFAYMLYNDVCKEKDVFDWTPMENLLNKAKSRGHQVVVRFRYTYPGKSCSAPDYIKALDDYEVKWAKSEGRNTEFPDWRCRELQRFHMEFHRRFAEKYDNDPRLAFLETGFGLWAEYHIYDGLFIMGQTFPSMDFQSEFLTAMDGWFKDTPWCISIDAADSKYGPFHKNPKLLNLGFGNFDDSFMCEDHDDYNYESWEFFGKDRYKRAPLGGEFSYYESYDQKHCLDKTGMYGRKFEDEVAKFHMTFIIGNDQPGKQTDARIKEACMSMGYRFQVDEFRVKTGTGAAIKISNVGVAPIYRDAFVAVGGKRGEYSLKNLMPGESRWIKIDSPEISEESKITIECDHLVSGQKIQFQASLI